jgi:general stress protein 26
MPARKTATPHRRKAVEPIAERPHMPGYGISESPDGMLPWSWARERLESCRNYFVASTLPDGRPHLMPVWAVWHIDNRLYFSTAITSRKARNLLAKPACTVAIEGASEALILEGEAETVKSATVLKPVWAAYKKKYDWGMDGEPMFALKPARAFAFIETADQFSTAATRWRFS